MPKKPSRTPDHRMVEYSSKKEFEEAEAQRLAAQAELDDANRAIEEDGLPTISAERRKELKKQARQQIEDRLKARRKARRLMRRAGGPS